MRQVGVRELKEKTSEILREVSEKRVSVEITNRGKVVARLVPGWKSESGSGEKFIKDMKAIAEEVSKYLPEGTSAVEAVKEHRREL